MGISGHEIYYHDLEVMGSKPGWVEHGLHRTSVLVLLEPNTCIGLMYCTDRCYMAGAHIFLCSIELCKKYFWRYF